jgi:hypothetical protein
MYIFDSDALIQAYKHDFPPEDNPGAFWNWLGQQGQAGNVGIPEAVFDEIGTGYDALSELLEDYKDAMLIPKIDALASLPVVLDQYGAITEHDIEVISGKADPFLVAHAMQSGATVVTNEVSRPNAQAPQNKKVPDICNCFGVPCIRYPRFLWDVRGVRG